MVERLVVANVKDGDELVATGSWHCLAYEELITIVYDCEGNKRIVHPNKLRENLNIRFRKEYLGIVVHRVKRKKFIRVLKIGDVVLVVDDNKKRIDWPMAVVLIVYSEKDGEIRVANVNERLK
ncbi:unnamed protein product [Allacma fusca]|uniref:DUF5641 domain-containing protein n=1 Tax=Allacma fusca TaxID=39272 RepID=A0A8J2M166_9HEXA|nr:unnamed protein product [Allacma fusca]